jgi:hypothetical protein
MQRTYFIRSEAQQEVGNQVETLADFPSVPKGSKGTVGKAQPYAGAEWVVRVQWQLSKRSSVIDMMVGDISLNLYKWSKPVTDQFCKSGYKKLVNVLPRK